MGFYSDFVLTVNGDKRVDAAKAVVERVKEYDYFPTRNGAKVKLDNVKWYESEDDLREISSNFPNEIFVLEVEGEEGGPYRVYYQNGKSQYVEPKVTWEPFDPKKLT